MRNLIVASGHLLLLLIVVGRLQTICAAPQYENDGQEMFMARSIRYWGTPFFWISRPINDDGEDAVGSFGGQWGVNGKRRKSRLSYAIVGAGWG